MSARANLSELLSIEAMPKESGLSIPESFYLVIHQPAPLAGMRQPDPTTRWDTIFNLGLQRVICLTQPPPDYQTTPLILAGHFPLQDLYGNSIPENPKNEQDLIYRASQLIIESLNEGTGVVVHCVGGTGRTGTVIGCTLRGLGYNSKEILSYLDSLNRNRGNFSGWPESVWQSDVIQKYPDIQG